MSLEPKQGIWKQLIWPWNPESNREAGSAVVKNFLLHWFPNRITLKSLSFKYSMYLGTITFTQFLKTVNQPIKDMFIWMLTTDTGKESNLRNI